MTAQRSRALVVGVILSVFALVTAAGATVSQEQTAKRAMAEAIQYHYRAYETYSKVIDDLGDVFPFAIVADAHDGHIAKLAGLFKARGWDVPRSRWNQRNVPEYATLERACAAAAKAESDGISMYDRLLQENVPSDVRAVFRELREASKTSHLPAFERCQGICQKTPDECVATTRKASTVPPRPQEGRVQGSERFNGLPPRYVFERRAEHAIGKWEITLADLKKDASHLRLLSRERKKLKRASKEIEKALGEAKTDLAQLKRAPAKDWEHYRDHIEADLDKMKSTYRTHTAE